MDVLSENVFSDPGIILEVSLRWGSLVWFALVCFGLLWFGFSLCGPCGNHSDKTQLRMQCPW